MAINLQKGQKIDLTKGGRGLTGVMVGLGWDEVQKPQSGGLFGMFKAQQPQDIDCDASAILLGANGRIYGNKAEDFLVYYGNLSHWSGAIVHMGDNLTGGGDGDDEQIMVDLTRIPSDVARVVFVVNIYDANVRGQHFGMIQNAFIRLVDLNNGQEICRFNLSDNYYGMSGLVVAEIYRYNGEWKFNAIGQPVQEASRVDNMVGLYI